MTRKDKENVKFRILRLAALRSTGSPADLAMRLDISVRSVKRFVGEIRKEGNEIRFSQVAGSYVTENL
jgi:predicted transcriptional regulator